MKYIYSAIMVLCLFTGTRSAAQNWTEVGTGARALNAYNGIYTTCLDPAGNIYAAGFFSDTSGIRYVSKWNGTTWLRLPAFPSQPIEIFEIINALCSDTLGNIYAGGALQDSAGYCYVTKWDGTAWATVGSSLGYRPEAEVLSLAFDKHGNLYAAGSFVDATGHYYVAKWDGSTWSAVGSGSGALNANSAINTIFIDSDDNIYAAGNFTDSGVVDTTGNLYVAMWNGSVWSELGDGVAREWPSGALQIFSVTKDHEGNVYAGGLFYDTSGHFYVAKWNGSAWSELGGGGGLINSSVFTMCFDGAGHLCVAGNLYDTTTPAGSLASTYMARWDGSAWSKIGSDIGTLRDMLSVYSLITDPLGNLYAAGDFVDTSAGVTTIDSALSYTDTVISYPNYVAKYSPFTSGVPAMAPAPTANVYPNPADDHIYIQLHSPATIAQPTTYRLYNCLGQLMISGPLQGSLTEVSIASLPPGMYVLKLNCTVNMAYRVVKE